jgi:saccharopine dehydrogenase (NAD+, L-lysine-forming)
MPSKSVDTLHFWLRAESKDLEKRTPILPEHAKKLMEAGHSVTVEESVLRCVPIQDYEKVGCTIVKEGSWRNAPKECIILGLKELLEEDFNLDHTHIMFAHCYKNQGGWKEVLGRFANGQGLLWDLEFLVDDNGRRIAAFGRSAGFIGMAVGLKQWARQQIDGQLLGQLDYHPDSTSLVDDVRKDLDLAYKKTQRKPNVMVMGALGRCGGGAVDFAKRAGLEDSQIKRWDMAETKNGGPFPEILEADIFVNCILLFTPIPPFIDRQLLDRPRKLSVMVDVSCDTSNPHNPVPVYKGNTTFLAPTQRIIAEPVFDVISIDHLPSLVPLESSSEFGDQLIPHLIQCGKSPVWTRAEKLYRDMCAKL